MTLKRYFIDKYPNHATLQHTYGRDGTGHSEVDELSSMGIKNLVQLDEIIHPHLFEIERKVAEHEGYKDTPIVLTGLIFVILIIKYGNEYFQLAKKRGFRQSDFAKKLRIYQKAIAFVDRKHSSRVK